MQLLLLALALGILAYDGMTPPEAQAPAVSTAALLAAVLGPKLVLAALYGGACALVNRRLATPAGPALLRSLDRLTNGYLYLAMVLYGIDLMLGWLPAVRFGPFGVGDVILVDELLAMLPTLMLVVWSWLVYYPIDARLRESGLIARIDAGLPVYPVWTRTQYLVAQLRHQVALVFVPLLAVMAWIEAVDQLLPAHSDAMGTDPRPAAVLAGAMGVFLLAPVMLRHIWDTVPLPPGEVRATLVDLCNRQQVRVRELLLWRTASGGGGMINAAVMGLVAPLRYILLTDSLLDMLTRRQVQAVMAHELAHVRKGHMFWLLATAVGTLGLFEVAAHGLVSVVLQARPDRAPAPSPRTAGVSLDALAHPSVMYGIGMITAVLGWVLIFGWVSRRLERQADTFAVQTLAAEHAEQAAAQANQTPDATQPIIIDQASVQAMVTALQQVANLNHIAITRRSWRHGSIQWRQDYLRTLVGQRADRLPIDETVTGIKLATLGAIATLVAMYIILPPDLRPALLLGL